ncbi:hypothetical protein BC939DRAFT_463571 [Gamsiella multidivaricata]|uniref:uncharacterized protein n=1 Tax=Gamsiella multidivaricata TaxID=101098 RepID=UPI00221F5AEB|nr:uncharacterized protein BC939DRAFT_463571 [Gamsiella multidivaricata]KAG0370551.1 hypothetical protein BGZ54_005781 [Gamsiella multidivaricata]KAI7818309.1 hypothetical protein BC939DRAFT_463571 [Gamsiella multidivaricata]
MPASTYDLLPASLASLLQNASPVSTAPLTNDPVSLQAQLSRIPRSTWVHLGSECHNAGFAADIATVLAKKPASGVSSVSMFSTAAVAAKAAALLTETGMPRILRTAVKQSRKRRMGDAIAEKGDSEPLLWELYKFYKQKCTPGSTSGSNSKAAQRHKPSRLRTGVLPWQLNFLKSACPEIIVLVFIDAYLEYGPQRGFDRDLPGDLVEALDFEWRSNSALARRAVMALVQTLIACRRYAKSSNNSSSSNSGNGARELGLSSSAGGGTNMTTTATSMNDHEDEQEIERSCHQLALTLSKACIALEIFFETDRGRSLPKLQGLYHQEVAADTKLQSRSGQAGAGADRGIKRAGIGAGVGGTVGADSLDPVSRKRFKSSGGIESPLVTSLLGATAGGQGSPSTSLGSSSPVSNLSTTTEATSAVSAVAVVAGSNPEATLRSSSYYLDQALAGYPSPTSSAPQPTPVTSSLTSSANAQQQAKINNPLWSPIIGQTQLAQFPAKHAAQVESELERWISLLGRMDGAVFSEKLVGLIKAVYPSDQKFLLDQMLIDYMCWEGNQGREKDTDVEDQAPGFDLKKFLKKASASSSTELAMGSSRTGIRTGGWIMETVMGALVSLVIKPEESSTYLESGSKKWIEPIEIPVQDSEGVKNANLVSIASKAGVAGTPVLGAPAGTSLAPFSSSSSTAPAPATIPATAAAATVPVVASTFRTSAALGGAKKRRVRNLYNRRVSPFYAILAMFQSKRVAGRIAGMLYLEPKDLETTQQTTQHEQELLTQSTAETAMMLATVVHGNEIEELTIKTDRKRGKKRRKEMKRRLIHMMQNGHHADAGGSGETPGDGDVNMDEDPNRTGRGQANKNKKMEIGGETATKEEKEDDEGAGISGEAGAATTAAGAPTEADATTKQEQDEKTPMEGVTVEEQDQHQTEPRSSEWAKEPTDEEALALAKQVEDSRTICHAPFKVLIFILQYLTRANQAGALDAWITDALSATLVKLQVQYFEWILACLIVSTTIPSPPASSAAETGNDSGEIVTFEDELLRLVGVLVVAQGIGYEPVKTAFENVERAYQHAGSECWFRVRAMIEAH